MAIVIPPISLLPTPPTKADPNNFAVRADDFLEALPDFQTETNNAITEMNKITSGLDQMSVIAAWEIGTEYNFPDVVAGSDGYSYRCVDTLVTGVDPTTDDGTYWLNLSQARVVTVPVGSVVAFIGGYFSSASNTSFTSVLGNSAATINSLLNDSGWYVCNGAAVNSADSSIFNGAGRYLPNLTDDRFIMGDTAAGVIGGDNAMAHTHTLSHQHSVDIGSFTSGATTLTTAQIPAHTHGVANSGSDGAVAIIHANTSNVSSYTIRSESTGGGGSHTHTVDPPLTWSSFGTVGTTSAASNTENRPKFLSTFYIMRVL